MALSDYKLVTADYEGKRIADLSDRPTDDDVEGGDGLSADMLKAYFDYIPITVLGLTKLNGLIDFLLENGGGTLGIDEIDGLTETQTSVQEAITSLLAMVEDNKESLEAAIDDLSGAGRTTETVKQNASDILTIKGSGWTSETIKNNATQIIAMKGIGWTSENLKDITDTLASFMAQKGIASGLASLDSSGKLIQGIDGSNITSGMVPVWAIPDVVKERTVVVSSATEMLALTYDDIQEGDTVCIDDGTTTAQWYRVIDDTALGSYAAFLQHSPGTLIAETSKYYDPTATGDLSISVNFQTISDSIDEIEEDIEEIESDIAAINSATYQTSAQVASSIASAAASLAVKSTSTTATLISSSWSSAGVYNLAVSGVTATSFQEILPSTSISSLQLDTYQNANIICTSQSNGIITLTAYGDTPTINIPIIIIKGGN